MKKIAVIFAGGTGQRMECEIPKQFLKVCGKEIIIHTLEKFESNDQVDEIYIACIEDWIPYLRRAIKKFDIGKVTKIFKGGISGQDSIFVALSQVKKDNDNAIVLIHDGVRPIITQETINKCIKSVEKYGTAITATNCFETPIVSMNGSVVKEMPLRKDVYTAQAPQCFYLEDIYNVHLKEREINPEYKGIVDSCGLMFKNGYECHLIKGNYGNIKVTTHEDFCTLLGNLNAIDYEQFFNLKKKKKEQE